MINNSYNNFNDGIYNLCSSYLDKESGQYIETSEIDKTKCCLGVNKKQADICRKQCYNRYGIHSDSPNSEKYRLCYTSCENAALFSDIVCRRTSEIWGNKNPFIICAKELDCQDKDNQKIMVPECVKKNKDALIRCCRRNCIPTTSVNCDEHCDISFEATQDLKILNPLWANTYKMEKSPMQRMKEIKNYIKPAKNPVISILWYIIGISIILLISAIIFFIIKKKMS